MPTTQIGSNLRVKNFNFLRSTEWRLRHGGVNLETKKHVKLERTFAKFTEEDDISTTKKVQPLNSTLNKDVTSVESSFLSTSQIRCTICSALIDNFLPEYFCGEAVNPACCKCKNNDSLTDPFSSFPIEGMPSTLISHWLPSSLSSEKWKSGNLSAIQTLKSHYVKLTFPGD